VSGEIFPDFSGQGGKKVKGFEKVLDILSKILMWICAFLMLAMVLIVFIEVIRRYALHLTWPWSEELVRYMIVYATFLGGPAAYRMGALTCFDLVVLKMPTKTQNILKYVVNTIIIALCVLILKYSLVVVQSPAIHLMKSAGLKFSMSIPYASIPIGMILMIIFGIEQYFIIHKKIKESNVELEGGQPC